MKKMVFCFVMILCACYVSAQKEKSSFTVVPLGTEGGLNESNLSSYLVASSGSDKYVALDAGTLYAGIEKAIANRAFQKTVIAVLRQNIKAYCISHPHLDHVAGLIINSPADTTKNIYGTTFCLNRIRDHYFSWQTWANFGDAGEKPVLNKYHYKELADEAEQSLEATDLFVRAFPLSHANPFESTAFLLRKDSTYLLYFGDTGADTIEHSQRLAHIWQAVAPLVKKKQLKAIFIEVSYPDEQPDKQLFGHLTPRLLMQELAKLSSATGSGTNALAGLPLVITHMKPEGDNEKKIKQQVISENKLGLHIIFPEQGKRFDL